MAWLVLVLVMDVDVCGQGVGRAHAEMWGGYPLQVGGQVDVGGSLCSWCQLWEASGSKKRVARLKCAGLWAGADARCGNFWETVPEGM